MKKVLLVGMRERITPEMHKEYDMILVGPGRTMPDCIEYKGGTELLDLKPESMPRGVSKHEIATAIDSLMVSNQKEVDHE